MNPGRFYLLFSGLCLAGYAWVVWGYFFGISEDTGICLFRAVTGIPCPSCGSTRSVISILHGDLAGSLHWNILGYLVFVFMIIIPFWIVSDMITGKRTFYNAFRKGEVLLRTKKIALLAILFLVVNWIWNIMKIS